MPAFDGLMTNAMPGRPTVREKASDINFWRYVRKGLGIFFSIVPETIDHDRDCGVACLVLPSPDLTPACRASGNWPTFHHHSSLIASIREAGTIFDPRATRLMREPWRTCPATGSGRSHGDGGHTRWCHLCLDAIAWDRDQREWPVHLLYRVQTTRSARGACAGGVLITVVTPCLTNGRFCYIGYSMFRQRYRAGALSSTPVHPPPSIGYNVQRFRLAVRSHRPFRGGSVAEGRAGERKTCWANPLAPQLRARSRCCAAKWGLDAVDL